MVINKKHVGIDLEWQEENIMSEVVTSLPLATLIIMAIAAGIAFLNSGINRVLINYFVGWEQYRVMQKEMAEHRSETMAAMRANDKKQVEKLKKKDSQIKNMQAKMMKPQMVQFGISFVYLIVWFLVLTPVFGSTQMAFIPGIGTIANANHLVNGVTVDVSQCNPSVLLVPNMFTVLRTFILTHNRDNAHRTRRNLIKK